MNIPPTVIAPTNRNPDKALAKSAADAVAELRFRVKVGSLTIGRFRECTGIAVEVETKDYMEGGNNDWVHKLATGIKSPDGGPKRRVTHEAPARDGLNSCRSACPGKIQELRIELI